MILRRLLTAAVLGLPVLVLVFGVVLGASLLTSALGDAAGSYGLFWCAMVALILLVIDALLLLVLLGLRTLDEKDHEQDGP